MENNELNNNQQNVQQPYGQQPQQPYAQPQPQQYQQQQYAQAQQAYQQPVDPAYEETVGEFLKQAIFSCVMACFPVACIFAIFKGSKNRKNIMAYLEHGGVHTNKVTVSSILSNVGKYYGLGMTIIYAILLIYYAFVIFIMIIAAIGSNF